MASARRPNLDAMEGGMVTQFPKFSAWLVAAFCSLPLGASAATPQVGSQARAFRLLDLDG